MKPLSETQNDIRRILEKYGVALGYIFGSYARGTTGPLSDVDVAVVFNHDVPKNEYFDRELTIASDVGKLLKIDKVDVINIETVSSPLLKHRAVIRGICVLDSNHARRMVLEQRILQDHEDTQYLRKVQAQIMHRHLQQGTFGKPLISRYAYGAN